MTGKDKKEDFCLACAAAPALVSAISGAGAAIEAKDASKDTAASTNTKKDTIIRDVLIGVSVVSAIVAVVMLLKKNGKKRKKRRR